jgi:mannosyltransferase
MTTASTLGLVAITLGGLALRLHLVDSFGVWFDEAYHVALVGEPTVGAMLDAVLSNPPSDPLYALMLRWWTGLAGTSDAAIRLPSVVFGTATIPAAAWLASALGSGSRPALLAAGFVAVSPYALEFSQEAAPYALAALAMTLALAAAWRWRTAGSPAMGVAFMLAGVLAVYSHYVAVAVLALTGLLGALRWAGRSRVKPRTWLAAPAAIGLAWMPWAIGRANPCRRCWLGLGRSRAPH